MTAVFALKGQGILAQGKAAVLFGRSTGNRAALGYGRALKIIAAL